VIAVVYRSVVFFEVSIISILTVGLGNLADNLRITGAGVKGHISSKTNGGMIAALQPDFNINRDFAKL
jgi:hypothetical protein